MQQDIELPLPTGLRRLFAASIVIAASLPLLSPVQWAWGTGWAVLVLATSTYAWHRYRVDRPTRIVLESDGMLSLATSRIGLTAVVDCRLAVVKPYLIAARLHTALGTHDLFLPRGAIDADAHWTLRRALLRWRPVAEDPSVV